MKNKNIKMYSLSDGKFVVSYYDSAKSKRTQKNFTDELAAKIHLNKLKAPEATRSEFSYLKTASTDTAVRVYLQQVPNSYLGKSKSLVREFIEFFSVYGVQRLTEQALREFFVYQKNERELADRTLLVIKSQLQVLFKFLIAHKIIDKSPLDEIKFNRGAPC
jgi:hypothetical protein